VSGRLVFVGTYTEPIRFGTGQILQGRGEGIHAFRLDPASGALQPCGVTRNVRNASYLAFDPSRASFTR
jgi:6-phosphogluconolactonase